MHTLATVFVVATAGWVAFSAYSLLSRKAFIVDSLTSDGVPQSWWTSLGLVKALGALGLLVGLVVPVIGVLAALGLVLYFVGAEVAIVRARQFSHIPFPLLYLAPAAVAGVVLLAR